MLDQPVLRLCQSFEQAAQPQQYCQGFSLIRVEMEELKVLFQVFFERMMELDLICLKKCKKQSTNMYQLFLNGPTAAAFRDTEQD